MKRTNHLTLIRRWFGIAMLCGIASLGIAAEPSSHEELAGSAIRAGQTHDHSAVSALSKQLRHESPLVRQASVWALGQLGANASDAVPALIGALEDSDTRVRWGAATALGQIGRVAQGAESSLWQASHDENLDVCCSALAALRSLTVTKPSVAIAALSDCLQRSEPEAQAEAIATVAAVHSRWNDAEKKLIASRLTPLLKSPSEEVRLSSQQMFDALMPEPVAVSKDAASKIAAPKVIATEPQVSDIQPVSTTESLPLPRPTTALSAAIRPEAPVTVAAADSSRSGWQAAFTALLVGAGIWGVVSWWSRRSEAKTTGIPSASASANASDKNDDKRTRSTSEGEWPETSRVERSPSPALRANLDDSANDSTSERRATINTLSDAALNAAAALNQAMSDDDSVIRWRSASAVTAIHAATVPQLLAAMTSEDAEVRRLAITSLRGLGADVVSPFVAALQEDDARLRQAAAVTLGQMGVGAIDAVPQLTTALNDRDSRVRAAAASALATFGPHAMEAVPALRTVLADESSTVRARAAFALGQIGPAARRVTDDLVRLVSDPDVSVRRNVVSALGGIGADTAVILPALRQAMSDADDIVRQCASTTLAMISHNLVTQSAPPPQESPANKPAPQKPTIAGAELKVFDPDQSTEPTPHHEPAATPEAADLIDQLEDTDADVRWNASQGLEKLGASAVPEMIASLNHRNPAVRRLLIVALGRVGTEARASIPAMLVALHDVNSDVRCAAADSLGQFGVVTPALVQALAQSLTDPNAEVRRYAATTLGRFGRHACDAKTALQITSISDNAAKVRSAAQTALQRITESLTDVA